MGLSKLRSKLKSLLKKYLSKSGRINGQLEQIANFIKVNNLSSLLAPMLAHTFTSSNAFKLLILLNKLVNVKAIDETNMIAALSMMSTTINGDFQAVLDNKMIAPYRLYLQKRVTVDFYDTANDEPDTKVYQLLNLINLGTSFTEMIYTIGRYYMKEYEYAIDFNITLAADIKFLYTQIMDRIKRPASESFLLEIQLAHEKMYIIFYNCYFHSYVRSNVPRWILTDSKNTSKIVEKTAEKIPQTKRGLTNEKNGSTATTKRGSTLNSSLEQSSLLLLESNRIKQKDYDEGYSQVLEVSSFLEDQKERLDLLHSLERIAFQFSV